jgi:hypothetical protein
VTTNTQWALRFALSGSWEKVVREYLLALETNLQQVYTLAITLHSSSYDPIHSWASVSPSLPSSELLLLHLKSLYICRFHAQPWQAPFEDACHSRQQEQHRKYPGFSRWCASQILRHTQSMVWTQSESQNKELVL